MEKIWLVTQESSVDGEIYINATPCATKERAKKEYEKSKKEVFTSGHFARLAKEDIEEYCDIEECGDDDYKRYCIMDNTDSYYEEIKMFEEEVLQ